MKNLEEIKTLGNRTDLFILSAQAEVEQRVGYVRILTPDNPGYFWGNFLFFSRPPGEGDLVKWQEHFRHEFRLHPEVRHCTFGWDSQEQGDTQPFVDEGFTLDATSVLTLRKAQLVKPPRANPSLEVRELKSDADWEAMTQNQIATRLETFNRETYEPFKRRQVAAYRKMSESGAGSWYGGFLEGHLVADCGLYLIGQLGRFQSVGTHPDYRRKGICGALVHAVCESGFRKIPGGTLVMAAASEEPAERIYRSVGFSPQEKQFGLCKWPKELWVK